MQFAGDPLCEVAGHGGAFFKADSRYRNQRADVGGTHARMCAVMTAHIDKFGCAPHAAECGFSHGFRFSDKCHYRAVCSLSGVDVEQFYALDAFDCVGYRSDDCHVASLAEVGNAFDDTLFHGFMRDIYNGLIVLFRFLTASSAALAKIVYFADCRNGCRDMFFIKMI